MKLNFKLMLFCVGAVLILYSCNNNSKSENKKNPEIEKTVNIPLSSFDWLEGVWVNEAEAYQLREVWKKQDDQHFTATSIMLVQGDTAFSENITLKLVDKKIYYIVSVSIQNDSQEVIFDLTSADDNIYVFENPQHDFPQTIVYRYVAPDSIYAYIEGNIEGRLQREDFIFKRQIIK